MSQQWQQNDVPDEVLAGAHFVEGDESERGGKPAEGQIVEVFERKNQHQKELRDECSEAEKRPDCGVILVHVKNIEVRREIVSNISSLDVIDEVLIEEQLTINKVEERDDGCEGRKSDLEKTHWLSHDFKMNLQ